MSKYKTLAKCRSLYLERESFTLIYLELYKLCQNKSQL